jgi:gluconolactonase
MGTVWIFDALGQPVARIKSCKGLGTTNCAFGGPDNRDLYITESDTGCVLRARLDVRGRTMFSHMD